MSACWRKLNLIYSVVAEPAFMLIFTDAELKKEKIHIDKHKRY